MSNLKAKALSVKTFDTYAKKVGNLYKSIDKIKKREAVKLPHYLEKQLE